MTRDTSGQASGDAAIPPGLRYSEPTTGDLELQYVARVLASGYLGMGPETRRFEEELAAYLGGGMQVVCVNSCTAALHLAVAALGIAAGDEVLVPAITFVATLQAVAAAGAKPVVCDVDPRTGLLDIEDAAGKITARTRAVMPVHYGSYAGNLEEVHALARRHGLRVIEDAAHAFGSRAGGRLVGSCGDVVCFSFDPIKNITAGEGGAVVTADPQVAGQVRLLRVLGIEKSPEPGSEDFDVTGPGFRYHMSDINAAIGRAQLARFETELKPVRQAHGRLYQEGLADLPLIRFLHRCGEVVPHIMPVRVLDGRRDALRRHLLDRGIPTTVHYKPAHLLTRFRDPGRGCPQAEALFSELLTLPLHAGLAPGLVSQVVAMIREFFA